MRNSSIVLVIALVAAAAFALGYGTKDSSSSASSSSTTQTTQDTQEMPAGAVDTAQLPPNHPPINAAPQGFHDLAPTASSGDEEPAAIAWKVPTAWSPAPNPNAMRLATYKLPHGSSSETDDTELVVSRAGGDVQANISRWAGQFAGAGTPKETKKTVRDLKVTVVAIEGTYQGGMGPSSAPREGWALLGAIVETKGQSYFFKVIGPANTVRAAQKPFDTLVDSITPS